MSVIEYTLTFTGDELQAMGDGLAWVNAYYGEKPDPPTPGMSAASKIEKALGETDV